LKEAVQSAPAPIERTFVQLFRSDELNCELELRAPLHMTQCSCLISTYFLFFAMFN
jgi:hypothetical protein